MRNARTLFYAAMLAVNVVVLSPGDSSGKDTPPLTAKVGPYMVHAKTFRGPTAEVYAKILASELQDDFGLPAFVYPSPKKNGVAEFAVLVGDEKSMDGCAALCKVVRTIEPKCLEPLGWSQRRLRGLHTTNPLAPKPK